MITAGSLFSGIGGLDLAASLAGFDIRFQVEIDPFCRKVLTKHAPEYWSNAAQFTDVRECTGSELGYVDVLFGGFPCQDISVAGNGVGIEGERSGLWWEFCRLIGEIRPRAIVLENVAAITYDGRGGTAVIAALAGLGYSAQWGIVSAADAGAPHERKRWFCVGYRNGTRLSGQAVTDRGHSSCDQFGDIEVCESNGQVSRKFGAAGQILRAKTRLAYPYRQRRAEIRGYRAEARKRTFRTGAVGNTNSQHIKEQCVTEPMATKHATIGCTGASIDAQGQAAQPGVGRNADGIPARMDGNRLMMHQFPARPNEAQHDSEPQRLISRPVANRRSRIKALGNAVVPQVAYPIFKLLADALGQC